MPKYVEHLFKFFSDIWDYSIENFFITSVPHSYLGFWFVDIHLCSLFILDINPQSVVLVKIFSHSAACRLSSWQCPYPYRRIPSSSYFLSTLVAVLSIFVRKMINTVASFFSIVYFLLPYQNSGSHRFVDLCLSPSIWYHWKIWQFSC